jgi:hypothetical protein
MVLEKDGEDQLDRACGKCRSIMCSKGEEEYPTKIKRRKANWIGHFLLRNCRLKHVTEGKIKGRIEVTVRRGRKHKQLLDNLEEKKGC